MQWRRSRFTGCDSGQALVETVLILPLVLTILFNAINFGYFFLVALNLSAAPRSGVEYGILGAQAPGDITIPVPTDIRDLTRADLTGAISSGANTPVQVCTKWLGALINPGTTTQRAACSQYPSGSASYTPASDPNSPYFVLHRVDATYTFTPIIRATPFNLVLLASPVCTSSGGTVSCTFHRQTSMRVLD